MKFDTPATTNPIDQLRVVGKATDRIDGRLKTTGTALYAYENSVPDHAYGVVVGAPIAKGRIGTIDTRDVERAPGVIAVVTAQNAGKLGKGKRNVAPLLGGPEIAHYHQAVALVVANSFEEARHAARQIRFHTDRAAGRFDLAGGRDDAMKPADDGPRGIPDTAVGDFEGSFLAAPVRLDQEYTTPDQSHAMMEPHASIARWDHDARGGNRVTIWSSTQMVDWAKTDIAVTLGLAPDAVHIMSPYVGGGFGGKLFLRADATLAALGARAAGRPVKVTLERPLIINNTTHRPATIQRIRIGAEKDGRITAIGHESWSGDQPGGKQEAAVDPTRLLYAGANRMTATRLAALDLPEGNSMRAPGDAPGLMALEIAVDEMAEALGIDPVEFRILNDTQVDPEKPDRPFSMRQLTQCLRTGAERFGWSARNRRPGETRDGAWLIGHGMAAAFRGHNNRPSGARARLSADGIVTIETDMTDIGTGSYTIIAQTAAEMMGLPLEKIVVRLGDSAFPVSSGSGGQFGANSATAGVYAACVKLREAIVERLGFEAADIAFVDGKVRAGNRSALLADAAQGGELIGEDSMEYGDLATRFEQATFGSHFVEVAVHAATAEIRVRRMVAVAAAGRILNPLTARSQVIGAMTMGVGSALMEELAIDKRFGFFVNHDLASYEVPVHADIPHQEVIFLDETDASVSPMKAKGVGELGLCGVAAAIANAIYNATGVRVRDYPVTLDKLIEEIPAMT